MNKFLRFLSFTITRLTILGLIVLLAISAVFIGFDWANINVIVNEGLAQRAQVAFMNSDSGELRKFYSQSFLNRDSLILKDPYDDFIISNYNHNVRIKRLRVWPWQDQTKVIVEEVVTHIEGAHKDDEPTKTAIPPWENGKKVVVMEKDGNWRISDIVMLEAIDIKDKEDQPEDEEPETQESQEDEDEQ